MAQRNFNPRPDYPAPPAPPGPPPAPVVVTLRRTLIEVPSPRRGKPSYRWTTGYYVTDPNTGNDLYPPVRRGEAYDLARSLGATKIIVKD